MGIPEVFHRTPLGLQCSQGFPYDMGLPWVFSHGVPMGS